MFKKIIDNHQNGFIFLNDKKEVIYVNNAIKKKFNSYEDENILLLGEYLQCENLITKDDFCQKTEKCKTCSLSNIIGNIILEKKEKKFLLKGTEIRCNSKMGHLKFECSLEIYYLNDHVIIELFDWLEKPNDVNFLSEIINKSRDLISFRNDKLEYKYINSSFLNFFNISEDFILNKTNDSILSKNILENSKKTDLLVLENGQTSELEKIKGKFFRVFKEKIETLSGLGILTIAKDVTNEIKNKTEAEIDILTGLGNRRKYIEKLEKCFNEKLSNCYIIALDIDSLRNINNTYGHIKGDEIIRFIGNTLSSCSPLNFYRIGGDEFIGIIKKDSLQEINELCQDISKKLEASLIKPKPSLSIGIQKLDYSISMKENYELADKKLYISKKIKF